MIRLSDYRARDRDYLDDRYAATGYEHDAPLAQHDTLLEDLERRDREMEKAPAPEWMRSAA